VLVSFSTGKALCPSEYHCSNSARHQWSKSEHQI